MKSHQSLKDSQQKSLQPGPTRIFYMKPGQSRDLSMGYDWLEEQNLLPCRSSLEKSHILLGSVAGEDLDELYHDLQGEVWSPGGEAKALIQSLGLDHTSMSVGDIIEIKGILYLVDRVGFREIK